eukprot:s3572_g6.t1
MASRAAFFAYLLTVQASCFVSFILQLLGVQVSHGWVAAGLLKLLGTRFGTAINSSEVLDTASPVVYLSNHRSWGDFWTDAALLGGSWASFSGPSFISRALVAAGIPFTAAWGSTSGWLWFFARGATHKEGAVAWMKNFLAERHWAFALRWSNFKKLGSLEDHRITGFPQKGVVIYPEGTRSLLPEGLPLKMGALSAAYQLQWPVQVVITTNKECVTAERETWTGDAPDSVELGLTLVTWHHQESIDAFLEVVKEIWRKTWTEAYGPEFRLRNEACLPGGKLAKLHFSLAGSWRMQLMRLIFFTSLTLLIRRLWKRRSEEAAPDGSLNPSMLAGLAAAGAGVVLLPLAFCCFCPKKAGSAKKAKKKSKAKGGEDSPAADADAAKADEPVPLKKQKKAKASDEELDAKKAEVNRRKEHQPSGAQGLRCSRFTMRVRHLQTHLQDQGLVYTGKLNELRNVHVGVDAVFWLRSIQALKDPFADALGGIPPGMFGFVDKELDAFKEAGITPLFVFQGVAPGRGQTKPFRKTGPQHSMFVSRMDHQMDMAWNYLAQGEKSSAQKCFAVSTSRINGDFVYFIYHHLRNRGYECLQAPYFAGAQLAHFAEQGVVQTIFGPPGLLLYGVKSVVIHLNFGQQAFDWVDLGSVLEKWSLSWDEFVDACMLAGTEYCLTYPYLNLSTFQPQQQQAPRFNFDAAATGAAG